MSKNNYSDVLAKEEELKLFGKILPKHFEMQNAIATSLNKYFKKDKGNLTFLDIGCGYGYTSMLVSKFFPKAKYILNDFEESLLANANKNFKNKNFEKLIGDIEEVISKIPNNSLDAVYTSWVIHNFPKQKREKLFQEIKRVLKTNGVFVYLEKVKNAGKERSKDLAQTIVNMAPMFMKYKKAELYIEHIKHYFRDEEGELLFSDTENEKLLKNNNFNFKYLKKLLFEKVVFAIKK